MCPSRKLMRTCYNDSPSPSELKDKPYTGKYRAREGHLPLCGFSISRANVADFMLKAVENRSSIGKIVGISN